MFSVRQDQRHVVALLFAPLVEPCAEVLLGLGELRGVGEVVSLERIGGQVVEFLDGAVAVGVDDGLGGRAPKAVINEVLGSS